MANSTFITNAKNKIVKAIISDETIFEAIDSPIAKSPEDLIFKNVFDYYMNPLTLNEVTTYLTISVDILPYSNFYDKTKTYVNPQLVIEVVSNSKHMRVTNIPKINSNRNDYISILIDKMFNGKDGFGLGTLKLISNVEGTIQNDYPFRRLTFLGTDINKSYCDEE